MHPGVFMQALVQTRGPLGSGVVTTETADEMVVVVVGVVNASSQPIG